MPVAAIAAVATAGASVYASNKQSKAAKAAAKSATDSTAANNALQREIYGKNEGYLKPYIGDGQVASGQINNLLATNPYATSTGASFEADPGYQFRLQQGFGGVQQQNAATNTRLSGSAQKALLNYGQGAAAQEFGNWWNRDQSQLANKNNAVSNYLNALTGTRGAGISAGSALAGVGQNYAGQVGQNNQWAANQVGNAALVNGNNQASLANNLATTGANLFGQISNRGSSYNPNGSPIIPAPVQSWFR